jgi:hypothetical protein
MKPGKELDALVAEKVMGLVLGFMSEEDIEPSVVVDQATMSFDVIPHYSTDIAAAWEILEKFQKEGKGFLVVSHMEYVKGAKSEQWGWSVMNRDNGYYGYALDGWDEDDTFEVFGETAPHAICLAALRALGAEG